VLKAQVEGENESQLPPVTVRVFGPNTDAVIDRDRELQVRLRIGYAFGVCKGPGGGNPTYYRVPPGPMF